MKILYYYWSQYDDVSQPGGGIKLYLKNIIDCFKNKENVEIYTLNSGVDYNLSGKLYYEKIGQIDNIKKFRILNSPILAPSKCSFFEIDVYLNDESLKNLFANFINENGPFDVIHIQSIEGLGIKVLELKELFPNIKFVLSIHNYHYFCPQVNLWQKNKKNCDDFNNGVNCSNCLGEFPNSSNIKRFYIMNGYLGKVCLAFKVKKILKNFYAVFRQKKIIKGTNKIKVDSYNVKLFKEFREKNVEYINKYADLLLCVSNRVKNIVVSMGVNDKKVITNYIGTAFAANAKNEVLKTTDDKIFKIAYMGYMRKDKGLYFLVDALYKLDEMIAKDIEIIIAAKYEDYDLVERIKKLENKYKFIALYDGYKHEDIPMITKNLSLGIVPVMWEDCLPQVAIEFKAMGIPVLASDLGGASELSNAKEFKFKAGDIDDFNKHLKFLYYNQNLLKNYYNSHLKLKTIAQHCDELLEYYKSI